MTLWEWIVLGGIGLVCAYALVWLIIDEPEGGGLDCDYPGYFDDD